MVWAIFASALAFLICLLWYMTAHDATTRRNIGLATILTSLFASMLTIFPLSQTIKLGLDLKGGTSFLLELQGDPSPAAVEQAVGVIRKRLDALGTREITIQPIGSNRINVQIPGLTETDRKSAEQQLSKVAKLEFRLVHPDNGALAAQAAGNGGKLPMPAALEYEIIPLTELDRGGREVKVPLVVKRRAEMSGRHVNRAFRTGDELGRPQVVISFDDEGQRLFGQITGANVGQRLAIVLDGEAKSAPEIRSRITNNATISGGNMSPKEAEELASVLENPLETPVQIKEVRAVDPSLGQDSIDSGSKAAIYAFLGVVAYMVIYYRFAGMISVVALIVNLILLFGLLVQFHFTLTLPGIAGIVLTIGMAVDANVLIYERIRDELRAGKPLRVAVDTGFEKAFSAIFDANITTLIPSAILMIFGTGPLRGFAVTLSIGIIANLFAALVVSRNCFDWLLANEKLKDLKMMQFLQNPRFDFLSWRWAGVGVSAVILLAGVVAVNKHGKELLGVDFAGGDALTMKYERQVPLAELRAGLDKAGISPERMQYVPETRAFQLQTRLGEGPIVEKKLQEIFPQAGFTHGSLDSVGPQVGEELRHKAIIALSLGILGILVFAALRFEWSYAIAAAIGQLHDVLIAISFMAMLGSELTLPLVAAFLTIAGYSINDKIVVFDRIREGNKLREKGTFYEVINRSLNLTLARTLLTGGSCVIATLALIVFGGPIIRDFSVAMLIGILSGIYSSHFISPGLAWWINNYQDRRKIRVRASIKPEPVSV
jgi:SecD/SecF fusion protein